MACYDVQRSTQHNITISGMAHSQIKLVIENLCIKQLLLTAHRGVDRMKTTYQNGLYTTDYPQLTVKPYTNELLALNDAANIVAKARRDVAMDNSEVWDKVNRICDYVNEQLSEAMKDEK